MGTWEEFRSADPEMAQAGRGLIYRHGDGKALLATVRDDAPPNINPINVAIVGGGLYAFILRSAKLTDLERDGRYALHAYVDPDAPSEFFVRRRAREVTDPAVRSAAAAEWPFEVDDTYRLFEFDIESAQLGKREDADAWPPEYSRWAA